MIDTNNAAPARGLTLQVATANVLNLALPGHAFYEGQEPCDRTGCERKIDWLGGMLARLNADLMGFQELWDEGALQAAVARSGLRYVSVLAPGGETGATGTPRLGLATRLVVEQIESLSDFSATECVQVPEWGAHRRFERPLPHARPRTRQGTAARRCTTPGRCRPLPRSSATGRMRTSTRGCPSCSTRSG